MAYSGRCSMSKALRPKKEIKQLILTDDSPYAVWVKDGKVLNEKRQYRLETVGWFKSTGGEGFRVAKYVKSHTEGLKLLERYQAQVESF